VRVARSAAVLAALLTTLWGGVGVAATSDRPSMRSQNPPFFTADLAVAVDSSSHAKVRVVLSVPYPELDWERAGEGYSAGVELVVEMVPEKGQRRLYGDSWEKRLLLTDYAATVSHRNQLVEIREFAVPPGKYSVRVQVEDVRSLLLSEVRDHVEVRDLSKVPVGFADLELGLVDSSGTFVPFPSRQFGFNSGGVAVRAVLVDRRVGEWPRPYHYHWRVLDDTGAGAAQGDTLVNVTRTAEPVVLRPPHSNLFIGGYTFELEMQEGKTSWRTTRTFEVEESGPPHGHDFEQMLEALAYIADNAEVDAMRNKSPDEQATLWEAFWRRRDPTPDTPRNEYQIEFFRRLRYADQHFLGFGPGWRSDMGRAYIRYGPPDQTEQRQASATQPALEIWYYNQPYRRLVFGDREGFGRFTLLNPQVE
jgi:GWxTD domain-containing protein